MIATLGAAFVAEVVDMVFAAVTAKIRRSNDLRGVAQDAWPIVPDLGAALRAHRRGSGSCVHAVLPLDSTSVLHPGASRSPALRHVSAAAAARGRSRSEPTCRSRRLSSRLSRRAINTRPVTRRPLRSTPATSRSGWDSQPDVQERTYLCGLVHDIGKIGLPASLLLKDGPLTLEERRQMQEHPAIGETHPEEGRPVRGRRRDRPSPPRADRR